MCVWENALEEKISLRFPISICASGMCAPMSKKTVIPEREIKFLLELRAEIHFFIFHKKNIEEKQKQTSFCEGRKCYAAPRVLTFYFTFP